MSSPITPVSPGTTSYGLAWKKVAVLSVDGHIAQVRDQLSQTFWMNRTNLRAKSDPPEVGEEWIVDRSLGNDWTFAMVLNKPIPKVRPSTVYTVLSATARNAIDTPDDGMVIFRMDLGYHEVYDADTSTWSALPHVGLIKRWDPTSDLSMSGGTETVDPSTMVTFTLDLTRRYKITYSTRFSQTNAGGTMSVAFRYVAGAGPITTTSTRFLNYVAIGNGANNAGLTTSKVMPAGLSGQYTIGVSFFSGSAGGNATAYGASNGEGRTLILEDIGVPQQ